MSRSTNRAITFNDALYMVNNEGYIQKSAFSGSNQCMTRADIEAFLHVNNSNFSTYPSNYLIPYNKIQPRTTNWRGVETYCVQGAGTPVWQMFAKTRSSSSSWAFDRFRLHTADSNTKIQVRRPNGTIIGTQLFHSGGGWTSATYEHDFAFDLSGNATWQEELEIYISGIPSGAKFNQVYNTLTGWGATRGKDSGVHWWDLNVVNVENTDNTSRLHFNSTPITYLNGIENINAYVVWFQDSLLSSSQIDQVVIACNNNGITNGTLDISYTAGRTSASNSAWTSLANKGWTLTQ